jgi:hypothetical protein
MSRSESLAAFGATPLEHEAAIFAGHARAKTMGLRTTSVVRLKSALRHSDESPIKTKTLRLIFVSSYVKKTEASLRSRRQRTKATQMQFSPLWQNLSPMRPAPFLMYENRTSGIIVELVKHRLFYSFKVS